MSYVVLNTIIKSPNGTFVINTINTNNNNRFDLRATHQMGAFKMREINTNYNILFPTARF